MTAYWTQWGLNVDEAATAFRIRNRLADKAKASLATYNVVREQLRALEHDMAYPASSYTPDGHAYLEGKLAELAELKAKYIAARKADEAAFSELHEFLRLWEGVKHVKGDKAAAKREALLQRYTEALAS